MTFETLFFVLAITASAEPTPPNSLTRDSTKKVQYNQELVNRGFMVLERYLISEAETPVYASPEEEAQTAQTGQTDPEDQNQSNTDSVEKNPDLYLVIYGKIKTRGNWSYFSEGYFDLESYSMPNELKTESEIVDSSFLRSEFELTLTNNLIFRYILSPNVYQVRLELAQNDCLALFVFYDDSDQTLIEFDQKLNMLHVKHQESHVNYYLEEIRNYPDYSQNPISMKNPYYQDSPKIFLNVVCPFWKFKETNKIRGKGSFIFWDDLPIHKGKVICLLFRRLTAAFDLIDLADPSETVLNVKSAFEKDEAVEVTYLSIIDVTQIKNHDIDVSSCARLTTR